MLAALSRAAADGAGLPLYASKTKGPGLFPGTALGKQAAQRCRDEGYLQEVPDAMGAGRSAGPVCTLTDKGRAFLLSQVSPRQVLEDFVRVLEARESQVAGVLAQVRQLQTSLEGLRHSIAGVLDQVRQAETPGLNGLCQEFRQVEADPAGWVVQALAGWARSGASEDCPLPELYREVRGHCPELTLGAFHDALRRLQDAGTIYLHPWTGPLYQVPEPPCALLVGHEIAYYASLRENAECRMQNAE
jgi:hypothetical protein